MKLSKYNFVYTNVLKGVDDVVVYNARTSALAILQRSQAEQLRELGCRRPIQDIELENSLYASGYIIDDHCDELAQIKDNLYTQRYNRSFALLTIAPTMTCNFGCIYCFEKHSQYSGVMSDYTISQLIEFVKRQSPTLKKLEVLWFGGEPLVAIQQIRAISLQLIEICRLNDIDYTATMSSNGYLLDTHNIQTLKECNIDCIGVTLDGYKDVHNQRRMQQDGSPTYDKIVQGIINSSKHIKIDIKVTLDKNNCNSISDMVDDLRSQGVFESGKVSISLQHVTNVNNTYEDSSCLSDAEFANIRLKLMKANAIPYKGIYPVPKGCVCQADQINSWVIDPIGNLYRCVSDIGIQDKIVSRLQDMHQEDNNQACVQFDQKAGLATEYINCDATQDYICRECKYLPLCMGGCPKSRLDNSRDCSYWKYSLDEYIEEYIQEIVDVA
jgi:uncharacterized protein